MVRHHSDIGTPIFETDKHAHTNFMYTCLPHTVEPIKAPFEIRLLTARVVNLISCAIISFLEADNAIKAMFNQFGILLGSERHDLYLQVTEIFFCDIQSGSEIRHAGLSGIFPGYEQKIFKRRKLFNSLIFNLHLLGSKDSTFDFISRIKSTVYTTICARVS